MLSKAREIDPDGEYRLVADGNLEMLRIGQFDLVLSVFTFDNIPTFEKKTGIFRDLKNLLKDNGKIISAVSAPEIYINEWASFSTKDFPENKQARSGDIVKIIITDVDDSRPVEDTVCSDEDYRRIYKDSGLQPIAVYKPLATDNEPYNWVNETKIAPWVIYVLKPLRE